ncbi:MAG: hypothetical protein QXW71_00900 [Thermoplasmata archaeon]
MTTVFSNIIQKIYQIVSKDQKLNSFFQDIYFSYRVPLKYPALYFEILNFLGNLPLPGYYDLIVNFVVVTYDDEVKAYEGFGLLYHTLQMRNFVFPSEKLSLSFSYNHLFRVDKDLNTKIIIHDSNWLVRVILYDWQ